MLYETNDLELGRKSLLVSRDSINFTLIYWKHTFCIIILIYVIQKNLISVRVAHNRIGRGNLMLRHSIFSRILGASRVEWKKATPRFASAERRNENINLNKYLISPSGNRTHNQSYLQSHICTPAL